MTKDDLVTIFKDFLPALLSFADQEIEEDRLLACWIKHVHGVPYSLPDGIDSRIMIYPKKRELV